MAAKKADAKAKEAPKDDKGKKKDSCKCKK